MFLEIVKIQSKEPNADAVYIKLGDTARVTINATGLPPPKFMWFRGVSLNVLPEEEGNTLEIKNFL